MDGGRLRSPVIHCDLHQDIVDVLLCILNIAIKISVILEYACIQ